ncbi:MAG: hypothetical protein AABW46_02025 [Nanoarchaeota archaeon]
MKRGDNSFLYVGIDETRNGRPDIIVVAAYSRDASSLRKVNGEPLSKIKSKQYGFRNYLFAVGNNNRVDKRGLVAHMIGSLIFEIDQLRTDFDVLQVMIDGDLHGSVTEYLDYFLIKHGLRKVNYVAEAKADRNYPLVNVADMIARQLHRLGIKVE